MIDHLVGLRAAFPFPYVAPLPVGPLPLPYVAPVVRAKGGRKGYPEDVVKLVCKLVRKGLSRRQVAAEAKVKMGSIDSILRRARGRAQGGRK